MPLYKNKLTNEVVEAVQWFKDKSFKEVDPVEDVFLCGIPKDLIYCGVLMGNMEEPNKHGLIVYPGDYITITKWKIIDKETEIFDIISREYFEKEHELIENNT